MTKNYVCCTPYLSKHRSFYHVFCYTRLRWWHLQMLFSFFQKCWFFGWGIKGQKMTQNNKTNLSLYLRNCTLYDCGFLVHICKMPRSLFWNIFAWWDTIYWQSLHWSVFPRNPVLTQLWNLGTIWAKIIQPYVPGNYVS